MILRYGLSCLLCAIAWAADAPSRGFSPRASADDYPAQAENRGVRIAAEVLDRDQVRNLFSTDLSGYIVVEVAVWPRPDTPLDLSAIDFSLRADGSRGPLRPVSSKTIAGVVQRRSASRKDDITLYPAVGVTTGSWGTGTSIGVGVGMGGSTPGPASTDRDRRTMEMELEEKGLPDLVITKPVAGYLFFPATGSRKQVPTYELSYEAASVSIKLPVPVPVRH